MELQELVNKYNGYFIVNYDNFEVIYTEGYENTNGLWCYKISDLNKMPETSLPQKNLTTPTQQDDQNEANAEGENVDEANAE